MSLLVESNSSTSEDHNREMRCIPRVMCTAACILYERRTRTHKTRKTYRPHRTYRTHKNLKTHMTHMSHKTTSYHRHPYDQYCGTAVDSGGTESRAMRGGSCSKGLHINLPGEQPQEQRVAETAEVISAALHWFK